MKIVLVTAPRGKASAIARALVREKLAACVNILPVRSLFIWKGKECDEKEELMILKTNAPFRALERRIRKLHPYQIPEIVTLEIQRASSDYNSWVCRSTSR
jgi:periplasmic divalent cation tolerance protein